MVNDLSDNRYAARREYRRFFSRGESRFRSFIVGLTKKEGEKKEKKNGEEAIAMSF